MVGMNGAIGFDGGWVAFGKYISVAFSPLLVQLRLECEGSGK